MPYKCLPFLAAAIVIGLGLQTDAAETTPQKKKTTPAKKTTTAAKKPAAKRRSAKKTPPRPRGQQAPTPERYKEIQQALIQRGYLQGEPTGAWDPASSDALKRFQQDQKIEATGKLNSLSLIALGLGPKRNAAALARPPNENRSTQGNKGP